MSVSDFAVPEEQRGRQAVASLRGYVHQLVSTVSAWMRLATNQELLIEVAEDYAVLAKGALDMTQVKRETGGAGLTLGRQDARKAIISVWQFSQENADIEVRLHFLTTASATHERGVSFPDGLSGVAYWARAALGDDVEPVRAYLLSLDWPDDLASFLAIADAEELRTRLLRRINWLTGAEQTDVLLEALRARLSALAIERNMSPSDGEQALPILLLRVVEALLQSDRRLTSAGFEEAWERATKIPIAISVARQMLGRAAGVNDTTMPADVVLEPLPQRLSYRVELVDGLVEIAASGAVLWVHGSSGLGKSRLAQLVAARSNGTWHVVRLRGLSVSDMRRAMRDSMAVIDRPDLVGVILDDLPVPMGEPLRHWVRALATEAARLNLKLVVTSERAPLAPIGIDFAPWRLEAIPAPYLNVADVAEIITAAGGDPSEWAQIVHLTCGSGHPLFVDARIAGLASRGWPNNERLSGLIADGAVAELDEVRTSIALRLLNELDADTHTLLLRLSIVFGSFDRELVMAVAEAHRPLARPGVLLDFLVGPWIEASGPHLFKISPLLGSAGATGLGKDECDVVRSAIVDHLVARRPLHADFLSQLLFQALVVRHIQGLAFVAGAVLTSDNRRAITRACIPLAFLTSKEDGRLVPEHAGVSASLRLAQVIAVTSEPDHPALETVLVEADAEFSTMLEPIASGSRFTMLLALLASEEINAAPRIWMPRLLEYVAMTEDGSIPDELLQGIGQPDLGGLREDQFFFMMRSNRIADVAVLEELFGLLDAVPCERRRAWLNAGPTLLGGPPLFIQSAWSRQAMAGTLDAIAAVETYRRLAAIAERWGESAAAVECHRSAAVLLDEYIDDKEKALEQLDIAERHHQGDARLARTRAGVLAHSGRHAEAHELLAHLRPDYSSDEPLERALMLEAAGTSAARAGAHIEAADMYLEAYAVSEGLASLAAGVRVGMLCDAAVQFGVTQDWARALEVLADAHLQAEALADEESDRSWFAIQAVIQVAQWLNATHEGRTALPLQDRPGSWSVLHPTLPEDRTGAVALDVGLANAALLETRLGIGNTFCERFDAREQLGKVSPLSGLALRSGQIATAINRRDIHEFLAILPKFVATSQAALDAKAAGTLNESACFQIRNPENWLKTEQETARMVASELLAELLLDGDSAAVALASAELAQIAPALGELMPLNFPGTDYTSAALGAILWLQQPGVPDGPSLVQVSFTLFQWLSASSRSTLRLRVWREIRAAWRLLIPKADPKGTMPATSRLETALNLDGAELADYVALLRTAAFATGVGFSPDAEAIMTRATTIQRPTRERD